jgi:hypothetical protein
MVKIINYNTNQTEDGKEFCTLIVQGGIEAVKSQETERTYLTARTARVACTFNKATCESLIGTELPGSVEKVNVEPYDYTIEDTGEVITLSHRYEYLDEVQTVVKQNVLKEEEVL